MNGTSRELFILFSLSFSFLSVNLDRVLKEKRLEGIENQRPLIIELRKHKWNKNILPFLFKKENRKKKFMQKKKKVGIIFYSIKFTKLTFLVFILFAYRYIVLLIFILYYNRFVTCRYVPVLVKS